MAQSPQDMLKKAWLEGRRGNLSALSEAKLWAAREIWRVYNDSEHGLHKFAAGLVSKAGTGGAPTSKAVGDFYKKVDADGDWFPGKVCRESYGPRRVLSGAKVSAIARCATRMKKRGVEPTFRTVRAACPNATLNAETGRAVDKKRVYRVFREHCYDEGADLPWAHKPRYSKTALTQDMMDKRLAFATHVQSWGRTEKWFYNNVVWTDICNSVLPRSERKTSEQALARKGKKGWGIPVASSILRTC